MLTALNTWRPAFSGACVVLLALATFSACGGRRAVTEAPIPGPRYPKYLVTVTVDKLMPAARLAVRQAYGKSPLGTMQSGQRAYVVHQYGQDELVWEAIRRAWRERGVEAHVIGSWELLGLTRTVYYERVRQNLLFGDQAWQELGVFRPVFQQFFPDHVRAEFKHAFTSAVLRRNVESFFDKRPDVEHLYAGTGGSWAGALGRHGSKFKGSWIYYTPFDLLSKSSDFPGDVWNLVDDKIVRPVAHVSEGTIVDPEGTRLRWTLTPEQRQRWSRGSGENNHLHVYPRPVDATWLEGVVRASANHAGFYPTMTVTLGRHGRVEKVEGGGRTGDLFRMLVSHPRMSAARFPSVSEPGYWHLASDGFATNPKFVRDVELLIDGAVNVANLTERNRAGVQHFSFAHPARTDADRAYARAAGLPLDHTAHMHVYFPTVRWRLADTGEWVTIAEHGYLNAFDDAEVRALAARYGDPALIFRYEWIPGMPGINVPGDYRREYGDNPWRWLMKEWEQIKAGTYAHYVDDYRLQPPLTVARKVP
jgi:hypothetical protein